MHFFKLDEYFDKTNKYFSFFDGLFNNKKEHKRDILEFLGIGYSSYRNNKLKSNVNSAMIPTLLKYFNYKEINIVNKNKYEICLSKTYFSIYFKNLEEIQNNIKLLDAYILENNYLRPLFMLFKTFCMLNLSMPKSKLKALIADDLDYLYLFKNKYFINEYELIYKTIMYYFDYKVDKTYLNNLCEYYKELSWIYYMLMGSYNYLNDNDYEALIHYQSALEQFKEYYNMERTLITISNISFIYNNLKKYNLSLQLTSKIIGYVYSLKNTDWIKNITLHYLYANYQLKRYNEIMNFYQITVFDIKELTSPSAIICILASYFNNNIDKAKSIINYFKNDDNVRYIVEYIDTENANLLKNIEKTQYLYEIVEELINT